jgi:hypothetical protein
MESGPHKIKVSLTEDQAVDESVRGSLQSYISGLTVPQKVELSVKGNKEVRQILSRDPNKMVARALMGSPRLTENDIVSFASSPQTNEEVLRLIAENREHSSNTHVVLMLVSNPRTPVPVAIRFLGRLRVNELNNLCRNRSISALLRREAKRLAVRAR